MNASKIGNWLTIATNVGLIVGLVFVGFEYRQNSELIEIESRAARDDTVNQIIEIMIQNPSLIELVGKDKGGLTQPEGDRLRMLGMRLLMAHERAFFAATRDRADVQLILSVMREIYYRPRLNYGVPYAWSTFKAGRSNSEFVRWYQKNVVDQPKSHPL